MNLNNYARYRRLSVIMALTLLGTIASLGCDPSQYQKSPVTYYEQTYTVTPNSPYDSRCTYTNINGLVRCHIQMVGEIYTPKPAASDVTGTTGKFPAIIFNHGSEQDFADNHLCQIAEYYVPQGYIVFIPFRRGQGNDDLPNRRSTGIYINDFVDDFIATNSPYRHPTTCGSTGPVGADACYRQELLRTQANEEIREAMNYLEARTDVARKPDPAGDYKIAITGSSYGGQVTTYANSLDLGQAAAVIFSPAAHEWGVDDCSPSEIACGTYTRRGLMYAAGHAHRPAFYLQSRWDVDTRPTMNLPFAHGMSSPDASHARVFRSAIFNWTGGRCSGPDCTEDDFDHIHGSFCVTTSVWGPEVTPFLERNGVK
ncbi:MAG: hypothetical protein ABJB40_05825 [Acidobacteriota bacterium]